MDVSGSIASYCYIFIVVGGNEQYRSNEDGWPWTSIGSGIAQR